MLATGLALVRRLRRVGYLAICVFLVTSTVLYWSELHGGRREFWPNDDWALNQLEARFLGPRSQREFVKGPILHISNGTLAKQLGCPADGCRCFFEQRNPAQQREGRHVSQRCKRYTPVPLDKGQPWCLCSVPAADWPAEAPALPWRRVKRGLVMGTFDSANPTHQVHVHFFWIWLWLERLVRLRARQVELLADCDDPSACLGPYGQGLACALLSEPIFLPLERQPILMDTVKWGLGGDWPFPLWEHRPRMLPSRAYMNMVQQTKAYYQLPDKGLASPLKVIIAQRPDKPVAARSLTNAPQLASALQKRGLHVEIIDFGAHSFKQQLKAVQGAAALVGISGSDLINGIFLPQRGVVLEIMPSNRGHQVINVELHNVMRMAGKLYQRYHSPMNAQLVGVDDASINGSAYTLLKQIGGVEVDVPSCTAAIEAAAMQAAFDQTDRVFWEWHSYDPVNASMYSAVNQMKRRIRRQVTRQGK